MRSVAQSTFVVLLSASMLAPASAAPPCATGAVCTVAKADTANVPSARDRVAKFVTTPVVSYSGESTETVHVDDTIGGFSDVGEYGEFEPARVVHPPAPRLSLLARMRRAASRILSATASLPHF